MTLVPPPSDHAAGQLAIDAPIGRDRTGSLPAEVLMRVEDLTVAFATERGLALAVDGFSIELGRGETLGVVGESGSGKSVMCRALLGLLPPASTSTSGRLTFGGEKIEVSDRAALWSLAGSDIAMVFQDPSRALNPTVRVQRQLTEGMRKHLGLSRREADRRAVELLREVRLADPAQRIRAYPHELSGGMKQRVMIAIALSCGPSLLLADEPTTGLDVTIESQILSLLSDEQRARGMAMILITHSLGVVASRTDRVAVMYAGRVMEVAPTMTLFDRPRSPYTIALLDSIPRIDGEPQQELFTIEGRPPDIVNLPAGCRFAARCPRVRERCRREAPSLLEVDDDPRHEVACWYPVDTRGIGLRAG